LKKKLGPKFQRMGINMIEKFLFKWYKILLNFIKGSWGSTKWQMAKLTKPLHEVWSIGSMATHSIRWNMQFIMACYKIEGDEGNQFGLTSKI
jgi:hypothetical protein